MTHLEESQILELAKAASAGDGFDQDQIEQLEHLKTCQDCYEKFCILCALEEVVGEESQYLFVPAARKEPVNQTKPAFGRVLAQITAVRGEIKGKMKAVVQQLEQPWMALQFAPAVAMGVRGRSPAEDSVLRLEELGDEKTWIVFDPAESKLSLQLDTRTTGTSELRVKLVFDGGMVQEVTLNKTGRLLQGMADVPGKEDFEIFIEACGQEEKSR